MFIKVIEKLENAQKKWKTCAKHGNFLAKNYPSFAVQQKHAFLKKLFHSRKNSS